MRSLFVIIALIASLNAFAEHGVGNGGDNRELHLYQYLAKLNTFLKTERGEPVFGINRLALDTFEEVSDELYFRITENLSQCAIPEKHARTGKLIINVRDSSDCIDQYLSEPFSLLTMLLTQVSTVVTSQYPEIILDIEALPNRLTEKDVKEIVLQNSAIYHRTCEVFYPGKVSSEQTHLFLQKVFAAKGYVFKSISTEIGNDYFLIQINSSNLLLNCSDPNNHSACAAQNAKNIGKSQNLLVQLASEALKLPSCIRKEAIHD